MKHDTEELLKQFESTPWFEQVGHPIVDPDIKTASGWDEAIEALQSKMANKASIESRNVLTRVLHKNAERSGLWNDLAKKLSARIRPMIRKKAGKLAKQKKLPKLFEEKLHWDISNACMELEYRDIVPPRYFKDRARRYLAGHFPCGWEGDFPEGRLIVY